MKKTRLLILPAALLVGALGLSACGAAKPQAGSTTNSGIESSQEASASASANPSANPSTTASDHSSSPATHASPAACTAASTTALKNVVAQAQSALPGQKASFQGIISDITLTGQGCTTLVLTYTLASSSESTALVQSLESEKATLQQGFNTSLFPMLKEAGVANPNVEVVWKDSTGKVLSQTMFSPTGS